VYLNVSLKGEPEMPKERLGYIYKDKHTGSWIARITFTNNLGKRQTLKRQADSKPEARKILKKLRETLSTEQAQEKIIHEKMTFNQLAEEYKDKKVKPAEYRGDKKISGMRSYDKVKLRIVPLKEHFGKMRVRSITQSDVEEYRDDRLRTKTKHDTDRSIASVHRELEILRAILRFAKAKGYIESTPFEKSTETIIKKSHETKRTRIPTDEEETRLLDACNDSVRRHLRPLIIAASDTGARKNELLTLTWSDVDLDAKEIRLKALNTKTLEARILPISSRLVAELERLKAEYPDRERVFGIGVKFQHSWESACRIAGISDLHFHDLRHRFCTRMLEAGMPLDEIAKLSGHSDINTLFRIYINPTHKTIDKARSLLDRINAVVITVSSET
jgi:integrase